jgi:hypothetical protein
MTEISANLRGKKSAESNCHCQLFLSIGEGRKGGRTFSNSLSIFETTVVLEG